MTQKPETGTPPGKLGWAGTELLVISRWANYGDAVVVILVTDSASITLMTFNLQLYKRGFVADHPLLLCRDIADSAMEF